jgi:hypothetical protein
VLCNFEELESSLESILLENGFGKISEEVSPFGAKFLYKLSGGIYFQIICDYRDRCVILLFGYRYNLENHPERYAITGRYFDVASACSDNFEEEPDIRNYSSWEEYSARLVSYLALSLVVVLKKVTPKILEESADAWLDRKQSKFRFYRAE